jgi:hypothetical protein
MNRSDIKKSIIRSLDTDADLNKVDQEMGTVNRMYDFSDNFNERILEKLFSRGLEINPQTEFLKTISWAFPRIALTGVAAIILLLISIFMMEDSFSFNTILGLSESYDENIISMLTGN